MRVYRAWGGEEWTDTHRLDVCWKNDSSGGEVWDDCERLNNCSASFLDHDRKSLQFMMEMNLDVMSSEFAELASKNKQMGYW